MELAEEQERLADERERLADERERTADEQQRLADERERLADYVDRATDSSEGAQESIEWARDQLLRAEARVRRSLAEQERALATLERIALENERLKARLDRDRAAAIAGGSQGDEAGWAADRRDFVAAERGLEAERREAEADRRDQMARAREQDADERDVAARQREQLLAKTARVTRGAGGPDAGTELAYRELTALRETARRQRAAADHARRQAAADRADAARQRRAGSGADPYAALAAQFAALTDELFVSRDLLAVAERVVALSTECIPGAIASGVLFFEGVRPLTQVATDDIAKKLDAYQMAQGEGPIAESVEFGGPVALADIAREARWPSFRALSAELGVAGVVACELAVRRGQDWQSLGALTVYSEIPDVLDDSAGEAAALFAAHMAIVAAFDRDRHDVVRREAALHRALGSRDVIGQAKGILMERLHLTAGDAYDVLRRSSQALNIRLIDMATRLAETGELPN